MNGNISNIIRRTTALKVMVISLISPIARYVGCTAKSLGAGGTTQK